MGGFGLDHWTINPGTRSLAFDRRSPDWPRVVEACARWADVVIVGVRFRDAKARGIDFQSLLQHNPNLVYCQVTGYGAMGPWADYALHGIQGDAMAGNMPIEWADGQPDVRADYISQGTQLAGLHAAIGILGALYRRDHGGGAQYVSVSLWECALAAMWRETQVWANFNEARRPYKASGSRYNLYRTADDRAILLCPSERKFWESFVDVVGLPPEWKARGSWERSGMDNGYPDEKPVIAEKIAKKPLAEWERILAQASVPVAAVLDPAEAWQSEQAKANGSFATLSREGESVRVPLPPTSVVGSENLAGLAGEAWDAALVQQHARRGDDLGLPPEIGQHSREVLSELGLADLAEKG